MENSANLSVQGNAIYLTEEERGSFERTYEFVSQRGWFGTGENYFDALVKFLNKELDIQYALISVLKHDNLIAQTIAASSGGTLLDNFEYELAGTPCENVVGKTLCKYSDGIQSQFPADLMLVDMKAQCYFGIPLWDSKGEVLGLLAVLDVRSRTDVDFISSILQIAAARLASEIERDRIEAELRRSQKRFITFFEDAPDAMLLGDPETGLIVDVNHQACVLLKRSKTELVGMHQKLLHPSELEDKSISDFKGHAVVPDAKEIVENFVITSDGKWIPVEIVAQRIFIDSKMYLLGTFRDISIRKEAERIIRDNQEMLELAQEASEAGFWTWDMVTNEVNWSEGFYKLFHLNPAEVHPSNEEWDKLIHPDDRENSYEVLRLALKDKTKIFNEYRIILPNGEVRWLYLAGTATYDPADKPLRMSGICVDITQRKQMEEDIVKSLRDLKETNKYFVGREMRMIELKREINDLLSELGREKKYDW